MRVHARRGQELAEEVVCLTVTDGGFHRHVIRRAHMQGHRHHTVAAVHRLQRGVLRTGLVEDHAVPGVGQQ